MGCCRKNPVSLPEPGPGGYSCQEELCPHVFFSQERAECASSPACHLFCANLLHLLELESGALAKNVFVFTAPSPLPVKEHKYVKEKYGKDSFWPFPLPGLEGIW